MSQDEVRPFGRYQLIERVGRGGMGAAFLARLKGAAGFERELVVKRILPHLVKDADAIRQFLEEARLMACLDHPSIVRVFEFGDVDGEFFLAMEHVDGSDLGTVMRLTGVFEPGLAAYIVSRICRALAYAHAFSEGGRPLGLVHRDVTPSNVMLGVDGSVKLLDFGIAKVLAHASNKTRTGVVKGKLGYLAPEQLEGRGYDHRADVFGAGVLLHELLTGQRLFDAENDLKVIVLVRKAEIVAPSRRRPAVPPELDAICLRALERDVARRYPDAARMAEDLEAVAQRLRGGAAEVAALLRVLPLETRLRLPAAARPRARRTRVAPIAAAIACAAVGTAALMVVGTRPPRARPAPTRPRADVRRPTQDRDPTLVHVQVESVPAGAAVTVDDDPAPRGRTPLDLTLPRGESARRLELSAGELRGSAGVVPTHDLRVQVVLEREGATGGDEAGTTGEAAETTGAAAADAPRTRKRPRASAPDVRGGEFVDPFGR
jgi:serine/threonine-protein kinase